MASNQFTSCEDCCQAFADSYELSNEPAMQAIERSVLGCDYGGTSWTTMTQAERMVESLQLQPGDRLLDIGSGSGWPGLFLANRSGCEVTLVDLPLNALEKALARAAGDGMRERVSALSASGCDLPLSDGSVDAISHSDVLCCLPEKLRMLEECRRVSASGARMSFTVILIPEGLAAEHYDHAVEAGPPFIAAPASYPDMLGRTGWKIEENFDITSAHRKSLSALIEGLSTSAELAELIDDNEIQEMIDRRTTQVQAIDDGLTVRESYVCLPA